MPNIRHTLFNNLFISELDAAAIRSDAVATITADRYDSVCNAYIEATLNYLASRNLLNLSSQDAVAAARLADVATYLKKPK